MTFFYAIFIGILIILAFRDKADYEMQAEIFNTYEQILPYIMHDILYHQELRQDIAYYIENKDKKSVKKVIKNAFNVITGETYATLKEPVR